MFVAGRKSILRVSNIQRCSMVFRPVLYLCRMHRCHLSDLT